MSQLVHKIFILVLLSSLTSCVSVSGMIMANNAVKPIIIGPITKLGDNKEIGELHRLEKIKIDSVNEAMHKMRHTTSSQIFSVRLNEQSYGDKTFLHIEEVRIKSSSIYLISAWDKINTMSIQGYVYGEE